MADNPTTERRHDVDWLRVVAIGLLLLFHVGLAFEPWGGFIQNDENLEFLVPPISLLAAWRILCPLFGLQWRT